MSLPDLLHFSIVGNPVIFIMSEKSCYVSIK